MPRNNQALISEIINPRPEMMIPYYPVAGDYIMLSREGTTGPCGVILDTFTSDKTGKSLYYVFMNRRLVTLQGPEYLTFEELQTLQCRKATKRQYLADQKNYKAFQLDRMLEILALVNQYLAPKPPD